VNGLSGERALIIAPHADDAEFGLGGLLQTLRRNNWAVRVVILAAGDYRASAGRYIRSEDRQREAKNALDHLGVDDVAFPRTFAENGALETPYTELVDSVEHHIRQFCPSHLFTCLPSFNQDHRAVFDATITATRPGRTPSLKRIFAYEYPGNCWGPDTPSWGKVYVPLPKALLGRKLNALRKHESQFNGKAGEHISLGGAEALARLRGSECGADYAELLYLLREVF
jgi:N-acetylglucosamine malate deacetylase 1